MHAFGDDPQLARLFTGFMVVILTFSFGLVIYRLPLLRARASELDSWVSREAAFLVNNWILLFCAFFVAFATMFPTLSEAVTGTRLTVGPPFFNKWMLPIGLVLLFLTGLGPLLAWRKSTLANLRDSFLWPTARAGRDGRSAGGAWPAPVGIVDLFRPLRVCRRHHQPGVLARREHPQEEHRNGSPDGARRPRVAEQATLWRLHRPRRHRAASFLDSPATRTSAMSRSWCSAESQMTVGAYTVRNDQVKIIEDGQKQSIVAYISVFKGGTQIDTMYPAKSAFRKHPNEPPRTDAAIRRERWPKISIW